MSNLQQIYINSLSKTGQLSTGIGKSVINVISKKKYFN
ncbi:hypothetical protein ASZ90_008040 [hydrocarbon metagenome]|uniref:Uncharacterized protein n=1 Tax=hydrocarbon metagenome TaxID=938273 RepID=A0A0W8FMU3_9ZZZZ